MSDVPSDRGAGPETGSPAPPSGGKPTGEFDRLPGTPPEASLKEDLTVSSALPVGEYDFPAIPTVVVVESELEAVPDTPAPPPPKPRRFRGLGLWGALLLGIGVPLVVLVVVLAVLTWVLGRWPSPPVESDDPPTQESAAPPPKPEAGEL